MTPQELRDIVNNIHFNNTIIVFCSIVQKKFYPREKDQRAINE